MPLNESHLVKHPFCSVQTLVFHDKYDELTNLPALTTELFSYTRNNNLEGFSRLRSLVYYPDANVAGLSPAPPTARSYPNHPPPPPNSYQPSSSNNGPFKPGAPGITQNMNGTGPSRLDSSNKANFVNVYLGSPQFKPSPFYSVLEPLTSVLECKGEFWLWFQL